MTTLEDILTKLNGIEKQISNNSKQLTLFRKEISGLRTDFENKGRTTDEAIHGLKGSLHEKQY